MSAIRLLHSSTFFRTGLDLCVLTGFIIRLSHDSTFPLAKRVSRIVRNGPVPGCGTRCLLEHIAVVSEVNRSANMHTRETYLGFDLLDRTVDELSTRRSANMSFTHDQVDTTV